MKERKERTHELLGNGCTFAESKGHVIALQLLTKDFLDQLGSGRLCDFDFYGREYTACLGDFDNIKRFGSKDAPFVWDKSVSGSHLGSSYFGPGRDGVESHGAERIICFE